MLVVRFKVTCRPEQVDEAVDAFLPVVAPSRAIDGVVSFEICRDIADPSTIVATEVFAHRAALVRQNALPELAEALARLPELMASPPEATLFDVASSEDMLGG